VQTKITIADYCDKNSAYEQNLPLTTVQWDRPTFLSPPPGRWLRKSNVPHIDTALRRQSRPYVLIFINTRALLPFQIDINVFEQFTSTLIYAWCRSNCKDIVWKTYKLTVGCKALIIICGQSILTKNRIARGGFFTGDNAMTPSIAVGCNSPAVVSVLRIECLLLLRTPQQRLPVLFKRAGQPPTIASSRGGSWSCLILSSLGP